MRLFLVVLGAVLAVAGGLPMASAATPPQVIPVGTAPALSDLRGLTLNAPLVDLAATPSGQGYWQVASDGGIFTAGDAQFFGSTGNLVLNQPIVAMAPAPSGQGYWLLSRDGGLFAFGAAQFFGSAGGSVPAKEWTDIAVDPDGSGYWLLAADGEVRPFGAATIGSAPPAATDVKAVALVATPSAGLDPMGNPLPGAGAWVLRSDGSVTALGDAEDFGDATLTAPAVDLAANAAGSGLWALAANGDVVGLGGATPVQDVDNGRPAVAVAAHTGDGYWVSTRGPGPGAIAGRVVNSQGQPIAGICVQLASSAFRPPAYTDANGEFELINVPAGQHRVSFGCSSEYLPEFYNDAPDYVSATLVGVELDTVTHLEETTLARGSSVAGVVTKADGSPLAGACIGAFEGTRFGNLASSSVTGYYRLGGLRHGSYAVGFLDCATGEHLEEWWNDQPTQAAATPIVLGVEEQRTGVNAQLALGGSITGTVATADAAPLPSPTCVVAVDSAGALKQATASVTGGYRIAGLRGGSYAVHFNACQYGPQFNSYADEWWDDQPTKETSTAVPVTVGAETPAVNAVLERAATISGSVSRDAGGPAPYACVLAVQGTTEIRRTLTDLSGNYSLQGLRPGTYTTRFGACDFSGGYATEYWPDSPTLAGAAPIAVGSGETRPGINAGLGVGGSLTGTVTDAQGNPVVACVAAFDEVGRLTLTTSRYNNVTGNYRLDGFNDAPYKLHFRDCGTAPDKLAAEWYQDAATRGDATPVDASAGANTVVPPVALAPEAVISGSVTNEAGQPIAGVCVRPILPDGTDASFAGSTVITTVTGFYRITELPATSLKVRFDPCSAAGYQGEWWNDVVSGSAATPLATTAGATVAGTNAVLGLVSGVPAPPASATASPGDGRATVRWEPPVATGTPRTGYLITTLPGGATTEVGPAASSVEVTGLQNGLSYTFEVRARGQAGDSSPATTDAVRPRGRPGAPGRPTASPGDGAATVRWTAAASNGSDITQYIVTASPGGLTTVVDGATLATTVVGLANGTGYTFTVAAVNEVGTGDASAASDAVQPLAPVSDSVTEVDLGGDETTALVSGDQTVVTGDGFAPFAPGEVIINSTPRKLASFVTDAAGSFRVLVQLPTDLEPGAHTLVAVSTAPDGSVRRLASPVVVVSPAGGSGYRLLAADGGIFAFGDQGFLGSAGGTSLRSPVIGGATTPSGQGYWLVTAAGDVFTFGDASYVGSLSGSTLNRPIIGMAATPTGKGYWLVGADGGMFSFGDAAFHGSTGDLRLNAPIIAMTSTPTGKGYWLVASDGGIFTFGDAAFFGSTGDLRLNRPVVGMAAAPTGEGYWLVASDGGIFTFGDAAFFGSTGDLTLNRPIVALRGTPSGRGYRMVASDGGIFSFGDAGFFGSTGDVRLARPIIGIL